MRILYLTPRESWPRTSGAKLRDYYFLKHLSKRANITLVGFCQEEQTGKTASGALSEFSHPTFLSKRSGHSVADIVGGIVTSTPLPIRNYTSKQMSRLISDLCANNAFDIVHLEGIHMAGYVADCRVNNSRPAVFCNWHNIESELMDRYADNARLPQRWYARVTSHKLEKYEDFLLGDIDGHVVCSEREREILLERRPEARVATVPNGVDLEAYLPEPGHQGSRRRLVFVGSMNYHANVDGIVWFVREEWPAIRGANPGVMLSVVGASPSPEVQALGNVPGVEITGTVPEVRPYYEDALAAIVPLRVGGGTRLKILEAMAAGVPVVSTAVGREGLGADLYEHLLPADNPGDWLTALNRLSDLNYRSALVDRARDFVRTRYDWSILGERLVAIYEEWTR